MCKRAYLDNMEGRLNGGSEEVRALVKGELKTLDGQLKAAIANPATTDDLTKRHLQDSRDEIAAMMDPMVPRPARGGGPGGGGRGGGAGGR
jgi:hypothetical protein